MNKSPNKSMIAECDRLVQQIVAAGLLGPCVVSGEPAEVGHHMIRISNHFFRHNLRNIAPLTNRHHMSSMWAPHVDANKFGEIMMSNRRDQMNWLASQDRFGYHKAPDRDALLDTRDKLRAFLAAGKPFSWTEQETTNGSN